MKVMTSILVSLFSVASFAGSTVETIFEKEVNALFYTEASAKLKVNSLSRALVEVTMTEGDLSCDWGDSDEYCAEEKLRLKIEGLTYNKESKELTYKGTLCGKMKTKRRFGFKRKILVTNGNCKLRASLKTRLVDNGLDLVKRNYLTVKIKIKN